MVFHLLAGRVCAFWIRNGLPVINHGTQPVVTRPSNVEEQLSAAPHFRCGPPVKCLVGEKVNKIDQLLVEPGPEGRDRQSRRPFVSHLASLASPADRHPSRMTAPSRSAG